jgi:2-amino-4-hydroxy-6-hydroxymethyldihydropteridine diphosphokinase
LVAHGRSIMASAGLILPHPDAARRLFVMGPLAQIAPDWVHPVLGQTARALAAKADIGRDARPIPASAL